MPLTILQKGKADKKPGKLKKEAKRTKGQEKGKGRNEKGQDNGNQCIDINGF